MTHPQHLHALAALHSLAAAWPVLCGAVDAARAAAHDDGDSGTLRSATWGSGRSSGFARSAIAEAVAEGRRWSVVRSYEMRQAATTDLLYWVAEPFITNRLALDVPALIGALVAVVPRLHPTTAQAVGRHVAEEDARVRAQLRIGDDHQLLPGVACPACGQRRLAVRTSAPADRPIVCEAGCFCVGAGCRCGMSTPVSEVPHIWTRQEMVTAVRTTRRKARAAR